jgi:putative ABC transport system ATP-binding protein
MIQLSNLSKIYKLNDRPFAVLEDINVRINQGEFVSIIGESGSGKSTLLNILGLLDTFDSGDYFLNGINIKKSNEKEAASLRNKYFGFIFQDFNLIPFKNAVENVSLPLLHTNLSIREAEDKSRDYLDLVGLGDKFKNKPGELSGGQQQRVAIARALVNSPKVIIADEPTGALDQNTSKEIMNLLEQLNNTGITLVIVTHDPAIAKKTKIIYTITKGKLAHAETFT